MIVRTGPLTVPVNSALPAFTRVKMSGGYAVACAKGDRGIGTLEKATLSGDTECSVIPWNMPGTRKMICTGAVAQFAFLYGTADGEVDDADPTSAVNIGYAMTAGTGDQSIIEVLPVAEAT